MRIIPPAATRGARLMARWLPDAQWRGPARQDELVAYLTFDDGPTPTLTEPLLDRLAAHNAQATFFLIGGHAEQHPHLVRAIARAGHTIGNHTYTHPYPWQTPASRLQAELDRTSKLLADQTGQRVRCVRPPYGQLNGAMRTWCNARAHQPVMWDVMPGDFLRNVDQAYVERFVQRHIRPGSIIVLHDNPIVEGTTPGALDTLLPTLSADGWSFEAL
jgi:peptidoglycan/xylan/chitin deacetylase (PgdA/CDA1 family)